MGRKSKLSDRQWENIGKRLLAGEKASALAREYKVSPTSISEKFSERTKRVKATASLVIETEQILKALPISEQIAVNSLADELRAISMHLAGAGKYGAATAHRLSGLAHSEVQKIDDAEPLHSIEALKGVSALTRLANDSAEIGLGLLKANKEAIDTLNREDDKPEPKQIVFQIVDASA